MSAKKHTSTQVPVSSLIQWRVGSTNALCGDEVQHDANDYSGDSRASVKQRRKRTRRPDLVLTWCEESSEFLPARSESISPKAAVRRHRSQSWKSSPQNDAAREQSSTPLVVSSAERKPLTLLDRRVPATIPNSTLLEHIATSRFFHHYVSPTRSFCRLDLDYLSSIIDNASQRSTLAEAIIALGILTLPAEPQVIQPAARCRYSRALRFTNKALADAEHAKTDEVLMAVILLGLYQTTPDEAHSVNSWTAHLDGARSLLRIRGCELLHTGSSFRMFSMLRQQIALNCFMTRQPIPEDLVELSNELWETQDENEQAASLLMILYARMCGLFSTSQSGAPIDPTLLLNDATILDDDLMTWAAGLPSTYEYTSEPATVDVYLEYCDVYPSLYTAEVWMLYRAARMGVNSIITSVLSSALPQKKEEGMRFPGLEPSCTHTDLLARLNERLDVIDNLRNDMVATVAYFLGRYGPQPLATDDLPFCVRTPAINLLIFTTKTPGVSEHLSLWARRLVAELQSDEKGRVGAAIWTNKPHTRHSI